LVCDSVFFLILPSLSWLLSSITDSGFGGLILSKGRFSKNDDFLLSTLSAPLEIT